MYRITAAIFWLSGTVVYAAGVIGFTQTWSFKARIAIGLSAAVLIGISWLVAAGLWFKKDDKE